MRLFSTMLLIGLVTVAGCDAPPGAANKAARDIIGVNEGNRAPELEGVDTDGNKIKLSALRGKVVVLDFWATWCKPCREMIPHEKALVERMKGKPFVLLGISEDNDKAELASFLKAKGMGWPNIFDGDGAPLGRAWGIKFLPTIFVIDAEGIIRYKNIQDWVLDKAVDKLVAEAESRSS